MKDTVFLIPTAKVLAKVVDGIDSMDMNNKDIMGDVYEYLLGKIASAGENGQFRTPRHIINMMVQLMRPTLKDKILDKAIPGLIQFYATKNARNRHFSAVSLFPAFRQHS